MQGLNFDSIASLIPAQAQTLFVAYSGGVDSHALLHLLATQPQLQPKIVAVYVHHGLQAAADYWGNHGRAQAEALAVNFQLIKVDAKAKPGESPEAAARNARYQALSALLNKQDLLLLAQHREDQMETLLLQLLRGAGIQGLAAMPALTDCGCGQLLRPLLNIGKAEILEYARLNGLHWVDDPSNDSEVFDRNFLRLNVLPVLKNRWPSMDKTIARSARHCAEAADLLETWTKNAFRQVFATNQQSLSISALNEFTLAQQKLLVREWFITLGLKPPSEALLGNIFCKLIATSSNADPKVFTQNHCLRKYRQQLFCFATSRLEKLQTPCEWPPDQPSINLLNNQRLERVSAVSGINSQLWHAAKISVKMRTGGEKIKLPGRNGQHCLKKLYQEAGIPPWERQIRPLIYLDGRLAAVAGLWIADWACARTPEPCYQVYWQF